MEYQVLTMGAKTGSLPRPKKNYLNESHGFMSWAGTLDHKRIGIMYLVGVLTAFLMGGMLRAAGPADAADADAHDVRQRC